MASIKISGLPEQTVIADDDYLVFGKDEAMKIPLSALKTVLGIVDVLTKANIANSYAVNTDGFALDARAGKDLNERLANWINVTQSELFAEFNGNTITSFMCLRNNKTIRLQLGASGTMTTNSSGFFIIARLNPAFRPKFIQSCGVIFGGYVEGDSEVVLYPATVFITPEGYMCLCTGVQNKTYGNESNAWTGTQGFPVTWDIS